MSTEPQTCWKYLAPKPGSHYKQLFVRGKNIAARSLYALYLDGEEPGLSPEAIAADFDLPVEAVQEAIAYCKADPPEIRADWEADEALARATSRHADGQRMEPLSTILSPGQMIRLQSP